MEGSINDAISMACRAHTGQKDKAGHDYIQHPIRVMRMADTTVKAIVAVLHDTVEDTVKLEDNDVRKVTIPMIRHLFDDEIADAVDAITHRPHEPLVEYYARVKANMIAHAVKLLDIADNTNPARLALLPEESQKRFIEKYAKAMVILSC